MSRAREATHDQEQRREDSTEVRRDRPEAREARQRAGSVALGRIAGEVVEEDFAVRAIPHQQIDGYRSRLRDWVTAGMEAGHNGLHMFQQVLMRRELSGKMKSAAQVAGGRAFDEVAKRLVGEVLPKQFLWLVGFHQQYVEGLQAGAGMKAVGDIVGAGIAGFSRGHRWACEKLDRASDEEIVEFHGQTDLSRPMVDAHQMATHLLLVYEEALRDSGAFTVREQLGRARELNRIESDVEQVEKELRIER